MYVKLRSSLCPKRHESGVGTPGVETQLLKYPMARTVGQSTANNASLTRPTLPQGYHLITIYSYRSSLATVQIGAVPPHIFLHIHYSYTLRPRYRKAEIALAAVRPFVLDHIDLICHRRIVTGASVTCPLRSRSVDSA